MNYVVTFYQSSSYIVDADTEEEAFAKAEPLFHQDMSRPVARTDYDDVEIELEKE